jgi:hypothetical protein
MKVGKTPAANSTYPKVAVQCSKGRQLAEVNDPPEADIASIPIAIGMVKIATLPRPKTLPASDENALVN